MSTYINGILQSIKQSNGDGVFLQAATEVLQSLEPILKAEKKYQNHNVLERLVIPEKTSIFRVVYTGDDGKAKAHFGYRECNLIQLLDPIKEDLDSTQVSILMF